MEASRIGRLKHLSSYFSGDVKNHSIEIPSLGDKMRLFNPSLFMRNKELHMVARVSNAHNCKSSSNDPKGTITNDIIIIRPDGTHLSVDYIHQFKFPSCADGYEDPRSFVYHGKLYLLVTDPQVIECNNQMKLLEFNMSDLDSPKSITPTKVISLLYKSAKELTQKNWMPFIKGDNGVEELFMIYQVNPHMVLKCDLTDGSCVKVAESVNLLPRNLRGGTPAKRWGDEYVTFAHARYTVKEKTFYTTVVYTFEKEYPFRITAISDEFFFNEYDTVEQEKIIQFVSGLEISGDSKEESIFHISYGLQDCESRMISIPEKIIKRLLRKIPNNILPIKKIVDRTFVICLERHLNRWKSSRDRLAVLGLVPELFRAVDGFKVGEKKLKEFGALDKRPGISGCIASHANMWRKIVADGIPITLICEDDIVLHENFQKLFPIFWQHIPVDFHMVQIGHCISNVKGTDLVVNRAGMCCQAYIVSLEGAQQLLDDIIPCDVPIDIKIDQKYNGIGGHRMFFFNTESYPSRLQSSENVKIQSEGVFGNGLVFQDRGALGSTIHQENVVHERL